MIHQIQIRLFVKLTLGAGEAKFWQQTKQQTNMMLNRKWRIKKGSMPIIKKEGRKKERKN